MNEADLKLLAAGQTGDFEPEQKRYLEGFVAGVQIAKAVNVEVIPLSEAPRGYRDFDQGAAKKFVLDPHGLIGLAS